jgi:hypothetical protein
MIKRKQAKPAAVCLLDIETRRVTHAGCPMCCGRRKVASVYRGTLVTLPCDYYGLSGRAEVVVTERGESWRPRRSGGRVSR